jgi:hypothetical protein
VWTQSQGMAKRGTYPWSCPPCLNSSCIDVAGMVTAVNYIALPTASPTPAASPGSALSTTSVALAACGGAAAAAVLVVALRWQRGRGTRWWHGYSEAVGGGGSLNRDGALGTLSNGSADAASSHEWSAATPETGGGDRL